MNTEERTRLVNQEEIDDRDAMVARGVPLHTATMLAARFHAMNNPWDV